MLAFFRLFFRNALPSLNGSFLAKLPLVFCSPIFRKGASLAPINASGIVFDSWNRPQSAALRHRHRHRQPGILHAFGMKLSTPSRIHPFFLTLYSFSLLRRAFSLAPASCRTLAGLNITAYPVIIVAAGRGSCGMCAGEQSKAIRQLTINHSPSFDG
jgi:hypothetical protein